MKGAPPLRFIGLVVGGWICARAAMLAPQWIEKGNMAGPKSIGAVRSVPAPPVPPPLALARAEISPPVPKERSEKQLDRPRLFEFPSKANVPPGRGDFAAVVTPALGFTASTSPESRSFEPTRTFAVPVLPRQAQPLPSIGRWSASAWAFIRRGEGNQLAAGGSLLGGSQVGARLGYRLNDDAARPLALSGRYYSPLSDLQGSEAAIGLEWKPIRTLPVSILAERRQAIGSKGRSAFALLAYGGVSERRIAGPVALDAYAQAGVVGAKSRDLFIDFAAALTVPIDENGGLKIGAAAWGAAQPGVARVDIGPQISYRLPVDGTNLRLSAEWRLRVAGDAEPGSGPALTLSTAF